MFTQLDHQEFVRRGLSVSQVESQLQRLRQGVPPITLIRPCRVNDGIVQIPSDQFSYYHRIFEQARQSDRISKFIPASGAASRMFQELLKFIHRPVPEHAIVGQDPAIPPGVVQVCQRLQDFPFHQKLQAHLHQQGDTLPTLRHASEAHAMLQALLQKPGLGYAELPKALLPFHRYPEGTRTSLEEHIYEALLYHADTSRPVSIHLTVSPQFEQVIHHHLRQVTQPLRQLNWKIEVTVSTQKPSTDTIALDEEGQPFREDDGTLIFRPGGHGSLLENLNDYEGDIVLISNIDNVVPEPLKHPIVQWRKMLGGYLADIQQQVFRHIRQLSAVPVNAESVRRAEVCIQQDLQLELPPSYRELATPDQATVLKQYLNRPIRVCGMVPNTGDPGGGPFWVAHPQDTPSRQIVEQSQVNADSETQKKLFASGTHFNPVDMVCGVRDYEGHPFNLLDFVDHGTCFIGSKSHQGRPLKALEWPGLWNGGMAHWITIFVEIPRSNFNPVKTFLDWLDPAHQPGNGNT